jgi:predicted GTPase
LSRWRWLQQLLRERALEFYLVLALLWLLPLLVLLALGLAQLWQLNWFWWFTLALVVLAVFTAAIRSLRRSRDADTAATETQLEPIPDWSNRDREVWEDALAQIRANSLTTTDWEQIPEAMLSQVRFIARQYHRGDRDAEFAFTVPELLLMLETWSREYRGYVLEHLPLAQQLKVSSLLRLRRGTSTLSSLYRRGSPLLSLARVLIDPGSAVTAELRSRLYAELTDSLGGHLQNNLKQALFEQVSQVAIDLYSGRLQLSEQELADHRALLGEPLETVIRPLTVLLIGQVNAGKSSLANALAATCVSEVDVLPTTAGFHNLPLQLTGNLSIYLLDSPGLDGNEKTTAAILAQAARSDLLLWLCQANQPAKALDRALMETIDTHFAGEIQRKPPPVLLVTTHNDLLPPTADWDPPYGLQPPDTAKATAMVQALDYNRETLGLGAAVPGVPIALPPGCQPYNLEVLRALLLTVSDEARSVQLNRERLDAARRGSLVRQGLRTIPGILRAGSKLAGKTGN